MQPQPASKGSTPLISPTLIGAQTICYDMAYGKGKTPALRVGRGVGRRAEPAKGGECREQVS